MAQGQKLDEKTVELIRTYLAAGCSEAETARKMGLPKSTVHSWKKRFEREAPPKGENEQSFAQLRTQNKEKFIDDAWEIVSAAQRRIKHALERAERMEEQIENAIVLLGSMGGTMSKEEIKAAFAVLTEAKLMDVGKLASVMGVMYDKRALAAKEPTEIVDGSVEMRFEDF